jgi:8-oxo-dGTP pyrophosphatase MutT (NUDIX family)
LRIVSSRVVYENRWMRVHEDRLEGGGLYGWAEKSPSALIVPIEGDQVWLIEQFRHPVQRRFWEFPQGAFEDGVLEPEALARQELIEETGLRAGSMEHLGRLHFAYGLTNQSVDIFRASSLTQGEQRLEDTEADLVVGTFSVDEVERMIRTNELRDAASIAAWHLATR